MKLVKYGLASLIIGASTMLAQAQDVMTARLGHVYADNSPLGAAAHRFVERINDATDGALKIEVFPNGQIGSDEAMARELARGTLEFAFLNLGPLSGLDPVLDIHSLPYTATNFDEARKLFLNEEGVIRKTHAEALDKLGIRYLGTYSIEFRSITNSGKPVVSPDDVSGMKIRIYNSPAIKALFDKMGAQTVLMPFTELFVALQQGTVDGQENGPILSHTSGLMETQKYMTLTNHLFGISGIVISQRFWDKLTPGQQEAVLEVSREISEETFNEAEEATAQAVEAVKAMGVEVVELTPEQMSAFVEVGRSTWTDLEPVFGADRISAVREEVEKISAGAN
ncbi:TRAP transporter substrate-binding protein [Chelativorans sp. Marseille-P2723]|uniref:TRAP transporter substrate-binding protein n=1 Tax=Chelativorans sp. Marseille-P2723 TaxID=2709133 RepID=UPI0015704052|nr:TRAP transporter substrate-binding protein [Chelativorans sp. Marseille-P2723]